VHLALFDGVASWRYEPAVCAGWAGSVAANRQALAGRQEGLACTMLSQTTPPGSDSVASWQQQQQRQQQGVLVVVDGLHWPACATSAIQGRCPVLDEFVG
jgi:hypothetical protein